MPYLSSFYNAYSKDITKILDKLKDSWRALNNLMTIIRNFQKKIIFNLPYKYHASEKAVSMKPTFKKVMMEKNIINIKITKKLSVSMLNQEIMKIFLTGTKVKLVHICIVSLFAYRESTLDTP